jgi:putrescine transport system ATP-binding protein
MSALLSVEAVEKSFGAVKAVRGVTFSVPAGSFFALLGPSGCGKTTLLRMIAGFEAADAGRILLDGEDLAGRKANRRPINLMFQSYALFPHMSVAANIAYGLEAEGVDRASIDRRVAEAVAMVKLGGLEKRKPAALSGGQRQRVALARALVKRPKLLLLDEPLGALDKKLRADMQIELKTLQRDTGIAFVVVTHDQEEALSMADQVCLLDHGEVVQIADPRTLYEEPATRFAADFIGRSNCLEGKRKGDRFVVDGVGAFAAANLASIADGASAVLAIRPERLIVATDPGPDRLPATVVGLAYLGSEAEARLRLASGPEIHARLSAAHDLISGLQPGATVHVGWPADKARVLT